jgi:hypothetical protein
MSKSTRLPRTLIALAATIGLLGASAAVLVAPLTQAPLVFVPASQWLGLQVTASARDAYAHAMMASGYEILPPVQLDDV